MAERTRIASLDGLRGLAASAVVFAHIRFFYPDHSYWLNVDVGDEAVALFFSLSGFLMAALYSQRPFNAADFMVHRLARIYPVYFVSLLVVFALTAIYGTDYIYPIIGPTEMVRHVIMLGSSGVYWSIPPEIQFYLYFLLIWLWIERPERYSWVPIVTAIALVVSAFFGFPGPGILLPSKLHFFLFGVIAGRLHVRNLLPANGLLVGLAAIGLLLFFFLGRAFFPTGTPFWGSYSLAPSLTAAVIVYLCAGGSRLPDRLLGVGPLASIGKISFSLYLLHLPVLFLGMTWFATILGALPALVLSLVLAYCVAALSYAAIEAPSRTYLIGLWKGRIGRRGDEHASGTRAG
jgi:peptidoglycan/LPS O-acetylase OafA/YrhL